MDEALHYGYYQSPLGLLEITTSGDAVSAVQFVESEKHLSSSNTVVIACMRQLHEYFVKSRTDFDLPLLPAGTEFQRNVWNQLTAVPFGRTLSYLDISKKLDNVKAIRAVGAANGQNPIAIIIPCHRIIGNNGDLTGYAGGLWRKQWLLEHEGALRQLSLL